MTASLLLTLPKNWLDSQYVFWKLGRYFQGQEIFLFLMKPNIYYVDVIFYPQLKIQEFINSIGILLRFLNYGVEKPRKKHLSGSRNGDAR